MCRSCFTQTGALVAAMLATRVTVPGRTDAANESQNRIRADMRQVLNEIVKAYETTEGEPNYDHLTDMVMGMGVERVGAMIRMAGYMTSVIDDINAHGVATMKAFAKTGDKKALIWLLQNAGEMVHVTNVEIVDRPPEPPRENDDVSFMRPRGATPGEPKS